MLYWVTSKSCLFLSNTNTTENVDNFKKMNSDFINILDKFSIFRDD